MRASDGLHLDVDLGVDWRQNELVTLDVGPVLSLADAVGNKVVALYSRGEARDYLDVDVIRASGRFTDAQLIAEAAERDPGFDVAIFARQLDAASRLQPAQVARYGLAADQLEAVKGRCTRWAADLTAELNRDYTDGGRLLGPADAPHSGAPTYPSHRDPPGHER